ncbi:arylesterase [Neiella sp. HB171785]|uniref:Arylesterase n=1 Tax=Neiella litorisoli TaxID=2771431 RepID=A0A8J6QK54_9GAMM|nr:arylesterase [Neiella litorisoli]MBD1390669.1 arylesterase [Neiella litorisoli]
MWKSLLACLLFFSSTSFAATVLIYGDSLSAGYGLEPEQAWPSLVAKRWQQQPWQVVNASVSGETTQGGLARLATTLKAHQPTLVFLQLGANDGLRGYRLTDSKANLNRMIDLIEQQGAEVILAEIMIPPNYGPRYSQAFTAMFTDIAQQQEIELLPFFLQTIAIKPDLMQADGLHPNASAQPLIADIIEPVLRRHIKSNQGKNDVQM